MTRPEHRCYGVSVLEFRPSTVRAVRAVGKDGLAVRTGQLRPTRPRLTRLRHCSRSGRKTLVVALRGLAPRGASRDGPPAPRRLGQPLPCTSPISDAPMSPLGHCLAGSRTVGKLAWPAPCDAYLAFTRSTKTAAMPDLAGRHEPRSGRLPSCRDQPGFPGRRFCKRLLG